MHTNQVQPTMPVLANYTNGKALTPNQPPEMAVCDSEDRFRRFVEYIPAAVAMVDSEMRYLAVSRRWQKDYGNSSYDAIGRYHSELFPNLPDTWWQNAQACLAGILPECESETFIIPNGKIEWVKWIFQPWYSSDGAIGGLILFTEIITESKHLEEALQLTQFAMDRAADAVLWMTSNGQLCYVNEAACHSLQYSRSELLRLSIHDIDPELSAEAWPNHWNLVKQQGCFTFESRRETKRGRSFPVEVTVNYLEFNGIEYHCAFARDITERKAAQAALLDAKGQLQAVLDAVPGLVSWVSSDLRYLGVNKHLAAAYKLSPQTFVGQKVGFLETSPRFNDLVYEFFASPDWASSKEVTATVKGESRTYLIVAQKYHQGRAAVFVGLEITERKRMEAALRRSEEKYRALTRNFPNGAVILFDSDLRFTLAEGTELEKIGLSQELMEGRTLYEVFPPEVCEQVEPQYRAALAGQPTVSEMTVANQIYLAHTLPLINEHGEVFAGMTMTQNITERKQVLLALQESEERFRQQATELEQTLSALQRTQTQLIQTEKMSSLGQLVAGVAHEINNPVNFISGNLTHASHYTQDLIRLVELYDRHYPNPVENIEAEKEEMGLNFLKKDLPKLLDSMKLGSERIRDVVRSLRHFSRLDEADMKPVDIHEGLDSTLLILQNRLQAKAGRPGISLIKEYGNLPRIECYAGQLNQVFMHLLTNAIDALEEGFTVNAIGRGKEGSPLSHIIEIRTQVMEGEAVAIAIKDNGPGMTEEVRRCIFDPLFTTKTTGKGTGLGLSISHHLVVEKHGGELHCFSEPGQGTEFVIKIPIK